MSSRDTISLSIPKKPEYMSLVRLTTMGIGQQANLTIDDIEDLKVSVSEACVHIMKIESLEEVRIKFTIEKDSIVVEIENVEKDEANRSEEAKLGLLIVEALMDEVVFDEAGVRLVKNID